ncbi:MAG: prolyl oligopeptidase family serine peptidase [Pyrinomonadaceae bacterium]|nr:prolyl oligopeptidase family serine peptidase [Pyrinomonadaceae bacterium]
MKKYVLQVSITTVLLVVAAQVNLVLGQSEGAVTSADYDRAVMMLRSNTAGLVDGMGVRPVWLPDGRFWYQVSRNGKRQFVLVNPANRERSVADSLAALFPSGAPNAQSQFRFRRAPEVPSPDGKQEAFIRDHNLWVRDKESKKETQLTKDGVKDFGYATDNAGWRKSNRAILIWSPDSKKIATYKQDQRHVSDMYLVTTNVGEPKLEAWKYPIPQDEEIIKIHRVIIDVGSGEITKVKVAPDARRGTLCDDISCTGKFDDNDWSKDSSKVMFVSSSRDHKSAKLRIADSATGAVKEIFEEKVETQFESGRGSINWRYLSESNEIIWYSERSDWGHLYLYDLAGKLKNQITKGDFVVTRLLKVDEKGRKLYFMANGREKGRNPYFAHLYSISFDGSDLKLLTPEDGNHRVSLSMDGKYFVDEYSKQDVPPVAVLRDIGGDKLMDLEQADISRLEATGWKPPMPFSVKSRDGRWDLYGLMFRPVNLDPNKKYPVVNYIYPGPSGGSYGSRSFTPSRSDHQALAELGFIVVALEGSCNPNRSKSFHDACYGNMADNTLPDQISGLKQLAKKHPYMDLERVGVWGHSGGGFAAAAAMFKYPDFYKVGISESGNHDNRSYEDDWGERYIGLIQKRPDGMTNYEVQANQLYAKNLKGKLMLTHGGMDSNVPPYNTYLVVDALVKANKDFDLIIFPNRRHGYGADSLYMMRRRWDYFVTHLLGKTPPKEYRIEFRPRRP